MAKGKAKKVLTSVLVLLIVMGAIGLLADNSNDLDTTTTFYLECEGRKITSEASNFELTKEKPLTVRVVGGGKEGYSVKVQPNVIKDKNFYFNVDEYTHSYHTEKELTKGFEIKKEASILTVKPKGDIEEVLQECYPNSVVKILGEGFYENMYSLVITSSDGKDSIKLNFSIWKSVESIRLDKEVIEF